MRVLIAGCGYVGGALAARLLAAGARVFGLRRNASGLPEGVEPLAGDVADPAGLPALPADLDLVFYLVGADRRAPDAYERAYVGGVAVLLDALGRARSHPSRLFFASSTAVYAQSGGEWLDESSPTEPSHFTGRALLVGEAAALAATVPATVVRFGGIYGPGRARLVERVRAGRASFRPGHWTNRMHRDDCAGALAWLAGLEQPAPLYLGVDAEPALEEEVLRWLAARLGAPPPEPAGGEPEPGAPGSKRCSSRRLQASGYPLRYPSFREGYAALLADEG